MNINKKIIKTLLFSAFTILLFKVHTHHVFAQTNNLELEGKVYEFEKNGEYDISSSTDYTLTSESSTYGDLIVSGKITDAKDKNNTTSYSLDDGNLTINYKYDDKLLNASEDDWHLFNDNSKEIYGFKKDQKIQKGAILIQTSIDGINWIDEQYTTNMFFDHPINNDVLYSTNELQFLNGCYYRITVVYELRKKEDSNKFLFIELNDYAHKKFAEVYEFYLNPQSDKSSQHLTEMHSLGEKVKVENSDGYYGHQEIEKNDIHYGWDLGNFFVSGFTAKTNDNTENITFLKNVGDKVTLWFQLEQDINKLNDTEDLSITADTEGFSQDFETPRIDLGRGTVIIQHTDYQGVKNEPQIYSNYLEASTKIGADTKVQNFEEGDYDIALLYEVTENKLLDDENHYKIQFSFSVRNGNCMVYPFDIVSNKELTTSSITENGFYLDFAKSRYLQINVKREIMSETADGLVEDVRFNKPASDGEKYTDEGIYTISATNPYTKQSTIKKIYVGTNNILKAHIETGLSIPAINTLVLEGCEVTSDGEIIKIETEDVSGNLKEEIQDNNTNVNPNETEKDITSELQTDIQNPEFPVATILSFVISTIVVLVLGIAIYLLIKKKKSKELGNNAGGFE